MCLKFQLASSVSSISFADSATTYSKIARHMETEQISRSKKTPKNWQTVAKSPQTAWNNRRTSNSLCCKPSACCLPFINVGLSITEHSRLKVLLPSLRWYEASSHTNTIQNFASRSQGNLQSYVLALYSSSWRWSSVRANRRRQVYNANPETCRYTLFPTW